MLAVPVCLFQWKQPYSCSLLAFSRSKKREAETQRDEEEFQAFMALELDPEERLRIDTMHPYGASGSS